MRSVMVRMRIRIRLLAVLVLPGEHRSRQHPGVPPPRLRPREIPDGDPAAGAWAGSRTTSRTRLAAARQRDGYERKFRAALTTRCVPRAEFPRVCRRGAERPPVACGCQSLVAVPVAGAEVPMIAVVFPVLG